MKVLKNLGPEFFKIKLQSLIYYIMCFIYIYTLKQVHACDAHLLLCCLLVITSIYNTLQGVIKVRSHLEAALPTPLVLILLYVAEANYFS